MAKFMDCVWNSFYDDIYMDGDGVMIGPDFIEDKMLGLSGRLFKKLLLYVLRKGE